LKDRGRTVTALDLGEAAALESLIEGWRASLAGPTGGATGAARALDRRVLRPLDGFLRGVDHVFVSPDGPFHLVPFAALVDGRGRFRVERFEFSYLASGRDLLRDSGGSSAEPVGPALVLGGVEFDAVADASAPDPRTLPAVSAAASPSGTRSRDFAGQRFEALPATLGEAQRVARALGSTAVFGSEAREELLKGARSPLVLHLATHAFFLRDLPRPASSERAAQTGPLPAVQPAENPMLRSGLALAGANRIGAEGEDGILTALEASTLHLSGTELVTLSACDTGVGEIDRGEGVLGLRRAFALAGARSLLMTLWSVNDRATGRLMEAYYERLRKGEGRSAALRAVQRQFLKDPVLGDPYYWAPFILSGDPGAVSGFHSGARVGAAIAGKNRSPLSP
jgi:CHAT domain-containing protein